MRIYDKTDRLILDIVVNDNSYRNRAIMGDHNLTLYYSLPEHVEIPVGAYCEFEGTRYFLLLPEQLKMMHTRLYDYTVTFSSEQDKAKIWKFRNTVDGRLKFTLTAKPKEHLQMFVDNMNRREPGWTVGECIDDVEKLISYDHEYCWDALTKQASTFNTEFEIEGKSVSLRKVEYNKSNPLPLSYGRGNGFKSGIGRSNSGDALPTEILFVQGGERNIDRSKYPEQEELRATSSGCLLLPVGQTIGYDGEHFEDEDEYNTKSARHYVVDDLGLSIRNINREPSTLAEDSLDRSDDYPKRVGEISKVVEVDKDNHFYDFIDSSIPTELNYEDYLIEGETMTVIFQDGMLAGREFDVKYYHEPKTVNGKKKDGRRFEIVPQEIDGQMMPGGNFVPKGGNKYAVFNVMLPESYIRNDTDKSGASWDMFRAAVKYLFDNEQQKYSFTGELDGLWAKRDWINIGGKIRLGGFVRFTDERFEREGVLVRITNIKDYINNPHSPKIELSNETVSGSVSSTLNELQSTEVVIGENHRAALQFTKRRFRDAKETIRMIEDALSDNFTDRISPIAVETMSILVGDERLQYQFVDKPGSTEAVPHNIEWRNDTKQLIAPAGTIQHLTLGIDSIRPGHEPDEYLYWNVSAFESASLADGSVKYYLYIRAVKQFSGAAGDAEFRLEVLAHKLEEGNYYWLLVGVLNTEYDGERSFATLYGFTEILPGRITADRLLASDGQSYFDMLGASMKLKDKLQFNTDGDGELKLKGVIVQSQNGVDEAPVGCYRGEYDEQTTYFNGDEVTYRPDEQSPTSSYRCISTTPVTGVPPTDTLSWRVMAAGVEGEPGKDGISPNASFKSTVFRRTNQNPETPSGGDFNNPVPIGWSDGIPEGEAKLWASTRIFTTDGKLPQQEQWSSPRQMTDTADFDVEFSSEENPSDPEGHPNTNAQWSNESSTDTIWMATSRKSNGVWSDWQKSRIKGENGNDGTSISIKGTAYGHFANVAGYQDSELSKQMKSMALIDQNEETGESLVVGMLTKIIVNPVTGEKTYQYSYAKFVVGDSFVMDADGHLWMGADDGWKDIGVFRGEKGNPGNDGRNAYVHIKYANSLTENDWTENNGETPGEYIGIYSDYIPTDSSVWGDYKWMKWTGQDGLGYEFIYKRTSSPDAPSTPTETSQEDGFVPDGWTDDPTGVTSSYPYEWVCYRKKTDGEWGAFIGSAGDNNVAALWAKYGQNGETGNPGNYTEYRFAVNGSTTTPPPLVNNALNPSGWSTTMPKVGKGFYLWMTKAVKNGSGTALVETWSTPVRITPQDGKDGADGASPVMVFRGIYNENATYYGNTSRLDCVKMGDGYYIARIDAGTFSTPAPPDTSKWNSFGASFESVATGLLLAELATIGNWYISGDNIASTHGTIDGEASDDFGNPDFKPDVLLDGKTGRLIFANGMELDSNGLSLIKDGYSKLRIVNGGIGSFTQHMMLKEGKIVTNGQIEANTTYHPSPGQTRQVTFKNNLRFNLGFMDVGSTIQIDSLQFSFSKPGTSWYTSSVVSVTMNGGVKIEIIKDGVPVMAKTFGSEHGSTKDFYSFALSSAMTYTVPTGQEGAYSIRISGNDIRFTVDTADVTKEFTIAFRGNASFARKNFERTILGNDGLLSCWGNGALYMSAEAFCVQLGNYAIRISESGGIEKTEKAISNTGWTKL